jgi:hypothetical protein
MKSPKPSSILNSNWLVAVLDETFSLMIARYLLMVHTYTQALHLAPWCSTHSPKEAVILS